MSILSTINMASAAGSGDAKQEEASKKRQASTGIGPEVRVRKKVMTTRELMRLKDEVIESREEGNDL